MDEDAVERQLEEEFVVELARLEPFVQSLIDDDRIDGSDEGTPYSMSRHMIASDVARWVFDNAGSPRLVALISWLEERFARGPLAVQAFITFGFAEGLPFTFDPGAARIRSILTPCLLELWELNSDNAVITDAQFYKVVAKYSRNSQGN